MSDSYLKHRDGTRIYDVAQGLSETCSPGLSSPVLTLRALRFLLNLRARYR